MLASVGSQIAEVREALGGGPIAALAAVLLLGVVVLFTLLIRSKDAQIRLAEGAQAAKLTEMVEVATDAISQLLTAVKELRNARKAFDRESTRLAKRTNTDQTRVVQPDKEEPPP